MRACRTTVEVAASCSEFRCDCMCSNVMECDQMVSSAIECDQWRLSRVKLRPSSYPYKIDVHMMCQPRFAVICRAQPVRVCCRMLSPLACIQCLSQTICVLNEIEPSPVCEVPVVSFFGRALTEDVTFVKLDCEGTVSTAACVRSGIFMKLVCAGAELAILQNKAADWKGVQVS